MDYIPQYLYSDIRKELHDIGVHDIPPILTRDYLDEQNGVNIVGSSANPVLFLVIPNNMLVHFDGNIYNKAIIVTASHFVTSKIYFLAPEGMYKHIATVAYDENMKWICRPIKRIDLNASCHYYHRVFTDIAVRNNTTLVKFDVEEQLSYVHYITISDIVRIYQSSTDHLDTFYTYTEELKELPEYAQIAQTIDGLSDIHAAYMGFMLRQDHHVTSSYTVLVEIVSNLRRMHRKLEVYHSLFRLSDDKDTVAGAMRYFNKYHVDDLLILCQQEWWDLLLQTADKISPEDKRKLVMSLVLDYTYLIQYIPAAVIFTFYNWRSRTTTDRLRTALKSYGRIELANQIQYYPFTGSKLCIEHRAPSIEN